ncbi:MAG: response regulator [Chloroflexi bacterium]|nr:response regulator [Chloroflexota bacterium]
MNSDDESDIKNWTVLVIDDAYDNAFIVSQILAFYGAKVQIAGGGHEALRILKWFQPTLILLDLNMPDMNGYLVKDAIRKLHPNAPYPIIAHTANVNPSEAKTLLDKGFDGYLLKPFHVDEVTPRLREILNRKRRSEDN